MKSRFCILTAGILLPCLLGAGENMFYNSSFELGTDGWDQAHTNYKFPYDPKTQPSRKWVEAKDAPFGKHVMQVTADKKLFSAWSLTSPDVKLTPGKKYTVSFYIKPDKRGRIAYSVYSNHYEQWHCLSGWKNPILDAGKWQRVHCTFVYNRKSKAMDDGYDNSFLLFQVPLDGRVYQFDGMQLEEGDLTAYKPAAAVEYKVTTPKLYLVETNKVDVEFSACSYDKTVKVNKNLILQDTGKDRLLQQKNVKFDLVPGKMQTQKVTFSKLPYGGFRIYVPETAKSAAVDFVRIHSNNTLYQPGKYAVGVGTSSLGLYATQDNTKIVRVNHFSGDEGELVRLSGSVVVHNFEPASSSFSSLAPEKRGEYHWESHDLFYNRLRQLKLKDVASIASQALLVRLEKKDLGKRVPDWLRKLDRKGHPKDGTCNGSWGHVFIVLPPPEVIAEAAAAICKRYGNDICMFRLFGEANGYMTSKQLFEYAKPTYTAIKKVSPKVVVNTINSTEDGGSVMGGYLDGFLKEGGGKYTDVITFHPYRSSQDDSATSAMDGIESFHKIMKRHGVNCPLAETECFYLIPNPYNNQPEYTWSLFEPAAITRRLCIDMGEGLIMSIPLEMGLLHQALASNRDSSRGYFKAVPNARFAAHNAGGYFLNGAVKSGKVKLPGTELCYTFENKGKKFSVIWCVSGKSNMTLNLPAGVTCKVYDIYGNLTKTASKTLTLTLDRQPQIIEWSGKADPKAIHAKGDYVPLQMIQFYGVQQMNGGVGILLSNRTAKPISGFVRLNSQYLESSKTNFSGLKPYAASCVFVPAKIQAGAPKTFEVTAVCMVNGKFLSKKYMLKQLPVLKLNKEYKHGPHSFKLEKKDGKLLFTGFLSSKKAKIADPKTPWDGDSIEIFCDYTPATYNPNKPDVFNDSCVQFIFPAVKSGTPVVTALKNKQNIKPDARVVRNASGAKVTVSLPYKKGMHINFNFNAEGKCMTFNGKKNYENRSGFAVLAE